ncbi:hypothetical protein ACB092_01G088800 [Castanea dentata]
MIALTCCVGYSINLYSYHLGAIQEGENLGYHAFRCHNLSLGGTTQNSLRWFVSMLPCHIHRYKQVRNSYS